MLNEFHLWNIHIYPKTLNIFKEKKEKIFVVSLRTRSNDSWECRYLYMAEYGSNWTI